MDTSLSLLPTSRFLPGLALGSAWSTWQDGLSLFLAIFLHEIGHEMANFVYLMSVCHMPPLKVRSQQHSNMYRQRNLSSSRNLCSTYLSHEQYCSLICSVAGAGMERHYRLRVCNRRNRGMALVLQGRPGVAKHGGKDVLLHELQISFKLVLCLMISRSGSWRFLQVVSCIFLALRLYLSFCTPRKIIPVGR